MKTILVLLNILCLSVLVTAQQPSQKKQQDIEALKVAFISKELALTPEEAQKFWPVYNQYSKELETTMRGEKDVLARDEQVLNLRKKYKDSFAAILGDARTNQIFNAEGRFRQLLIKTMRNQNQRNKGNRAQQNN